MKITFEAISSGNFSTERYGFDWKDNIPCIVTAEVDGSLKFRVTSIVPKEDLAKEAEEAIKKQQG